MHPPEIFKYGSLLSIPLFSIIALLLIKKTKNFSFSKHTVSKSVLFLNHSTHILIFRINFLVKALLDLCFIWYVLDHFRLSFNSLLFWFFILSALCFGSLAYFTEGKYTIMHRVVAYSGGVFWAMGQLFLTYLINDSFFMHLTYIAVFLPLFLTFSFKLAKKTNAFIQTLCMSIWYVWLLILIFRYL